MKTKFKALTFFFLLAVFIVLVLIPAKTEAGTVVPGRAEEREDGGVLCICGHTENSCSCLLFGHTPRD